MPTEIIRSINSEKDPPASQVTVFLFILKEKKNVLLPGRINDINGVIQLVKKRLHPAAALGPQRSKRSQNFGELWCIQTHKRESQEMKNDRKFVIRKRSEDGFF